MATVFPDGPHRYLGTVYDDAFCRRHGLDADRAAPRPIEIPHPAAVEVSGWARCSTGRTAPGTAPAVVTVPAAAGPARTEEDR